MWIFNSEFEIAVCIVWLMLSVLVVQVSLLASIHKTLLTRSMFVVLTVLSLTIVYVTFQIDSVIVNHNINHVPLDITPKHSTDKVDVDDIVLFLKLKIDSNVYIDTIKLLEFKNKVDTTDTVSVSITANALDTAKVSNNIQTSENLCY